MAGIGAVDEGKEVPNWKRSLSKERKAGRSAKCLPALCQSRCRWTSCSAWMNGLKYEGCGVLTSSSPLQRNYSPTLMNNRRPHRMTERLLDLLQADQEGVTAIQLMGVSEKHGDASSILPEDLRFVQRFSKSSPNCCFLLSFALHYQDTKTVKSERTKGALTHPAKSVKSALTSDAVYHKKTCLDRRVPSPCASARADARTILRHRSLNPSV